MDTLTALMNGPLSPLYCCIGDPVVGNPTQYMIEQAFAALGYPGRYVTIHIPAKDLEDAVKAIRTLGFAGANVTTPHKQTIIPFLDTLTDSAHLSGAVNCITRGEDGSLIGDNTDGKGFFRTLVSHVPDWQERTILIFGAGGAAAAITAELVLAEAKEVVIINRTEERAQALVQRMQSISRTTVRTALWNGTYPINEDRLIVVQATSVGLFDEEAVIDVSFKTGLTDVIACDVVFNPVKTKFLSRAEEAGAVTLDGLGMLVEQGAIAIEGWTGKSPDRLLMKSALEHAFSAR
jgi:shikimate dehydrogenase